MTRQTERIPLCSPAAGTDRHLVIRRWHGSESNQKAYIQASLHADETPAMLVAHHLTSRLDTAAAAGQIRGDIVLVPFANPIGLAQYMNGEQLGRYDFDGGGNFNRNWPDLAAALDTSDSTLADRLGADARTNVQVIRDAMRTALEAQHPIRELDRLRIALAREACDADLVLDLHCDDEALMHLFLIPQHWPQAADLASELGCRAVLLAEDSGGGSFDEAFSTPWLKLARRFPQFPIPLACEAATVELRGRADVADDLARGDAEALMRVLVRRGLVDGEVGAPPDLPCEATDLAACDTIRAPAAGILSYHVELGAKVRPGDVIADLIDPAAEPQAARRKIQTVTEGFLLSRRIHKFVGAGDSIAKVVGREPLAHRKGYLLED